MSDEEETVEPVTVGVRVDYYNDLMEAADLGYVVLVQRRMALAKMMNEISQYPERDASKMKPEHVLMLGEDVVLTRDDIGQLWRRADAQLKRLAEAMNARYAEGVPHRYKA
ncbi:MAG: hypothetical protein DI537_41115 [Stutzerimonas stutzeri]|nr:MAG: hypothetical protein DI537_41115 [Stutzerimonas stutzeri]